MPGEARDGPRSVRCRERPSVGVRVPSAHQGPGPPKPRYAYREAVSLRKAEHLPTEGGIIEVGRHAHLEAVKAERATDDGRFLEIHAGRPPCRNQLDEGAAVLGDDNPLA